AALREHEVVRHGLVVVEEVLLDDVPAVAKAEHEVAVAEVRVVAHHVPEHRSRADRRHRLGHAPGELAHPEALTAAEQHDLHQKTSSRGLAMRNRPPQDRTSPSWPAI